MQDYLDFVQDTLQDIANYKEQIEDLKKQILDKCPFHVGEIVLYNEKEAYISLIKIAGYPLTVEIELKEPTKNKKGGKIIYYFAKLHELTKINDSNI